MRLPGFEPEWQAWEARIITIRSQPRDCHCFILFEILAPSVAVRRPFSTENVLLAIPKGFPWLVARHDGADEAGDAPFGLQHNQRLCAHKMQIGILLCRVGQIPMEFVRLPPSWWRAV